MPHIYHSIRGSTHTCYSIRGITCLELQQSCSSSLLQLLQLCCSSRRGKTRHYFPHIFDLGALFGARRRLYYSYLLVIFTTHVYYSCLLLRARRRPRRARLSSQKSSSTRESLRFRTLWGRPQCRQHKARLHNYYSYLLLIFTTHIYYSYLLLIYLRLNIYCSYFLHTEMFDWGGSGNARTMFPKVPSLVSKGVKHVSS